MFLLFFHFNFSLITIRKVKTGDVARLESHNYSNPKTLGLIPWWGRVSNSFMVPPSQLLRRLVCA